jgi:hypothetical protein
MTGGQNPERESSSRRSDFRRTAWHELVGGIVGIMTLATTVYGVVIKHFDWIWGVVAIGGGLVLLALFGLIRSTSERGPGMRPMSVAVLVAGLGVVVLAVATVLTRNSGALIGLPTNSPRPVSTDAVPSPTGTPTPTVATAVPVGNTTSPVGPISTTTRRRVTSSSMRPTQSSTATAPAVTISWQHPQDKDSFRYGDEASGLVSGSGTNAVWVISKSNAGGPYYPQVPCTVTDNTSWTCPPFALGPPLGGNFFLTAAVVGSASAQILSNGRTDGLSSLPPLIAQQTIKVVSA